VTTRCRNGPIRGSDQRVISANGRVVTTLRAIAMSWAMSARAVEDSSRFAAPERHLTQFDETGDLAGCGTMRQPRSPWHCPQTTKWLPADAATSWAEQQEMLQVEELIAACNAIGLSVPSHHPEWVIVSRQPAYAVGQAHGRSADTPRSQLPRKRLAAASGTPQVDEGRFQTGMPVEKRCPSHPSHDGQYAVLTVRRSVARDGT
jgi:hypothetical protein